MSEKQAPISQSKQWWTRDEVVELVRRREEEWAAKFSEVNDAASRNLQELNLQDNTLLEYSNIFKAAMRRTPTATELAMMIFDSWTSGTPLLLDAKPIVHPARQWPSWSTLIFSVVGLITFGALVYSLLFTPTGTGLGSALSKPGVLLSTGVMLAGLMLLFFFLFRKRLERPVVRA